jgi:hypothetical protein
MAGPAIVAISNALVFHVTALPIWAFGTSKGVMLERAGQIKMRMQALVPRSRNTSGSAGLSKWSEPGSTWRSKIRAS